MTEIAHAQTVGTMTHLRIFLAFSFLTVLAISTSCSDESGEPGANCIDRTDCDAAQCSESQMVECVFTGDDVNRR